MNKLQAELAAGRPQADVVLIADAVAITQLKNDSRLLSYPDAPIGKVPAALIDSDRTYFGTKLITTGIVINTNLVKSAPKSWKDLLPAAAAGKTIPRAPTLFRCCRHHIGSMVQQSEFGWRYFETLARSGAIAARGNGAVIEAVARGEKAYWRHHRIHGLQRQGEGIAGGLRVSGGGRLRHHAASCHSQDEPQYRSRQAFVDWQLSVEAQLQSVAKGYFPIFPDIVPPKGYPPVSSLKIMPSDFAAMLATTSSNDGSGLSVASAANLGSIIHCARRLEPQIGH